MLSDIELQLSANDKALLAKVAEAEGVSEEQLLSRVIESGLLVLQEEHALNTERMTQTSQGEN